MSKVAEPFSIEKLTTANQNQKKAKTNKQEIVNDSQQKKSKIKKGQKQKRKKYF